MADDEQRLLTLAEAVADAVTVDWKEAESRAPEVDSSVIRQLRALADLAAIHRATPHDLHDPALKPGGKWGPLEIRREIGHGAFATVYLAWDPSLEREVALKLLHANPSPDRSAAVIREGRLLARVNHPNVVRVFQIDQYDHALGLTMEFVEGRTLKRVLEDRGAFSAHEAALTGIDLCGAVAAVHRAGLLHRDIKAQNVMRAVGGRIVLMDFGGGGLLEDPHTFIGNLAGTPLYLAPEILAGETASVAGDVYSLGVLLYHLVSLKFPVYGDSLDAIRAAHGRGESLPLSDVRPDLPNHFVDVVSRAIDRDPAKRYRSAGAMRQALVTCLDLTGPAAGSEEGPTIDIKVSGPSVAVLPFVNLGPDADIEYFCDGLAEELLTALGKVDGLRVVSRTASFRFRGRSADLKAVCRELDAGTALEGTVSKVGDQLRVTARLINGSDGYIQWSESYKRTMADVFAVQDEIAARVVERFRLSASALPVRVSSHRKTDNPRANHHYLKGRFHWSRRYDGELMAALECFQRAITEDAAYAVAHAGLADVYAFVGLYSLQKPSAAFALAAAAAERALAIDPNLAEAHTSLALITFGRNWDLPKASRLFTRAVELDGDQVLARIYHSWLMVLMDDVPSGMALARAAQDIDPLSPLVNSGTAYAFFLSRQYTAAVVECQRCLEIDPNFIIALYVKGMCRACQGEIDEAIELLERATTMSNRAPFYIGLLGNFYARGGRPDAAQAVIDELQTRSEASYVPPHAFAYVYAGLDDLDRAFEWQERACDDGAAPFNFFSPVIDNMQADPRHAAHLKRMGWQAWATKIVSGSL